MDEKIKECDIGHLEIGETLSIDQLSGQTLGWQIESFDFPSVWSQTKGTGVKVAVLDTGVDANHPDLSIKGQYDFVGGKKGQKMDLSYVPTAIHGTHVAGIIGATNDTKGIVGVAPECDIYACRVLNESGSGSFSDIMDGLNWCIDNGMDVVNMSLGAGFDFKGFYETIRKVYDAKITIVCAGGNSAWETGYLSFPGIYNETIGVASLSSNMERSWFSSIGANIDLAAPGHLILSTTPKNTYTTLSGTSMATPFVTGLVALLIAKHRTSGGNTPINNVEDVRNHLIKTAGDIDYQGQDSYTGHGIVSPLASLNYDVDGCPECPECSTDNTTYWKHPRGRLNRNRFYKIDITATENMEIVRTKVKKIRQRVRRGRGRRRRWRWRWIRKRYITKSVFLQKGQTKTIYVRDDQLRKMINDGNNIKRRFDK